MSSRVGGPSPLEQRLLAVSLTFLGPGVVVPLLTWLVDPTRAAATAQAGTPLAVGG